jgi:hypothetical protein
MTPEELARAGRDPSAYYGDYDAIRRKVLAGELPEEMLSRRGATTIRPGTTNTRNFNPAAMYEQFMNSIGGFTKNIDEPGGLLRNPEGNYRRSGGGKTGAAFGALETTLQDPVAGIISAPIGIGAGQLANMATTSLTQGMLQGPLPLKATGYGFTLPCACYCWISSTTSNCSWSTATNRFSTTGCCWRCCFRWWWWWWS